MKYVALLAFNRIVDTYPHLVSMHQDIIMDCIDDPDISIRLQALDLAMGMVTSDNLKAVVGRLMHQLIYAQNSTGTADDGRTNTTRFEPSADYEGENMEETLKATAEHDYSTPLLPAEYRVSTILRIIVMCSKDTYANIIEFEWYVEILMQLVKLVPPLNSVPSKPEASIVHNQFSGQISGDTDVASIIGWELRNVAVRVSSVRADAVFAGYSLMTSYASDSQLSLVGNGGDRILAFAAWIVGEFFDTCGPSNATLDPFIHPRVQSLPPDVISAYLQAIPKVLAFMVSRDPVWSSEHQTMMSLLVARVVHFLDPLAVHPSIEVQERSVEYLELMRIVSQALANHGLGNESGPLLLTKILPQLYSGVDLKPVAPTAQRKVPLPAELDLETPINRDLAGLLQRAEQGFSLSHSGMEVESFYNQRPAQKEANSVAFDTIKTNESRPSSYQQTDDFLSDNDAILRRRVQRRERYKDDPFYVGNDGLSSGSSTPFHDILKTANGEDVDVDSIPIMDLGLGDKSVISHISDTELGGSKRINLKYVHITKDEDIGNEFWGEDQYSTPRVMSEEQTGPQPQLRDRAKKSLLQVDSSGLSSFSLTGDETTSDLLGFNKREVQDEEMAKALAEVERLRLEMQRASERVQAADGTPSEGIFIKKKKKKRLKPLTEGSAEKRERSSEVTPAQSAQDAEATPVLKKKKRKRKPELQ